MSIATATLFLFLLLRNISALTKNTKLFKEIKQYIENLKQIFYSQYAGKKSDNWMS